MFIVRSNDKAMLCREGPFHDCLNRLSVSISLYPPQSLAAPVPHHHMHLSAAACCLQSAAAPPSPSLSRPARQLLLKHMLQCRDALLQCAGVRRPTTSEQKAAAFLIQAEHVQLTPSPPTMLSRVAARSCVAGKPTNNNAKKKPNAEPLNPQPSVCDGSRPIFLSRASGSRGVTPNV